MKRAIMKRAAKYLKLNLLTLALALLLGSTVTLTSSAEHVCWGPGSGCVYDAQGLPRVFQKWIPVT